MRPSAADLLAEIESSGRLLFTVMQPRSLKLQSRGGITCVRCSSHGRLIAVAFSDTVHIYDTKTTALLSNIKLPSEVSCHAVCFSPREDFVAIASETADHIFYYDLVKQESCYHYKRDSDLIETIDGLEWSVDGRMIIVDICDGLQSLSVYEMGKENLSDTTKESYRSVAVSTDGCICAFSLDDGGLLVCDRVNGRTIACWNRGKDPVWGLGFTPNGKGLVGVYGSPQRTLKHWDLSAFLDPNNDPAVQEPPCTWVFSAGGIKDGKIVISQDGFWILLRPQKNQQARLVNRQTKRCAWEMSGVKNIDFCPAAGLFVTAGKDILQLWNYTG